MIALLSALNLAETTAPVSFQNLVAEMGKEPRRQNSEFVASGFGTRHRPQIRTWPDKIVRFRHHDPRWDIVQPQVRFECRRDFDCIGRIVRRSVGDRYYRHHLPAFDDLSCRDYGAEAGSWRPPQFRVDFQLPKDKSNK